MREIAPPHRRFIMKFSAAIFDLDGTLIDTLEDLKNSVNHALRQFGFPERTYDEIKSFVGNGVAKLVYRSAPQDADDETNCKIAKAISFFTRPKEEELKESIAAIQSLAPDAYAPKKK